MQLTCIAATRRRVAVYVPLVPWLSWSGPDHELPSAEMVSVASVE